jgi:hypothetical protein
MYVSDPISIRNDYGYELIGRLRDRILLFRDKFDEFEVQAFDNQMHASWNKELDDLGRHNVQVMTVVGGKNDFAIIFKVKRRGHTLLRVHKYDPAATLIDSMTVRDYGDRIMETTSLDVVKSENKNCYVVYDIPERGKIDAVCFKLDKMQLVWSKEIALETNFSDDGVKGMVLSDAGELFLTSEHNNRRSKLDEHELNIWKINNTAESHKKVLLKEFLTGDVKFFFDNQRRRLVGGGLYGEKTRESVNGSFFISIGAELDTVHKINYAPFDDKFISILRGKDVEDDTKGIQEAEIRQLVMRQDGGIILIAERYHEIQRGTAASRGFWHDGMRMIVDYFYDDIFVIGMFPDGSAHWKTVLHKKQFSQDDEGTFSSFFLFRQPEKLHFLFNDEIKYENTCSEYLIAPGGGYDRNSLINTVGQGLRLRFRDALQLSSGECLIPSEFRNKLKLVLVRF